MDDKSDAVPSAIDEPGSVPEFSVVIPTIGRAELVDAVGSVLAQTVDDLECIVVDDHGAPLPALPADPRIRVVRRDTAGGPAAARNTGATLARGRYLTFLDDDDCWTTDRLELAREGLARAPVAICFSTHSRDREGSRSGPARERGRVLEGDVSAIIRVGNVPQLGRVALERTAFLPFDERYLALQDAEWWLRLAQVTRVATVQRVGLIWRNHPGARRFNDDAARLLFLQRLAVDHREYFRRHPRALAYNWRCVFQLAIRLRQGRTARKAFWQSIIAYPAPTTVGKLVRLWTTERRHRRDIAQPPITGAETDVALEPPPT